MRELATRVAGVISLLLYVAGGVAVALMSVRWIGDLVAGEPSSRKVYVGFIAAAVSLVLAAGIQTVRDATSQQVHPVEPETRTGWRLPLIALAVWAAAIGVSWVQFELYLDSVRMFPLVTLIGALVFIWGIGKRMLPAGKARRLLSALLIAAVGLPMGLVGFGLPMAHYTKHLTPVRVVIMNMYEERETHSFDADEPAEQVEPIAGAGTMEMIQALAAQELPPEMAARIASGEWRREEDGSMVAVNEDGTTTPVDLVSEMKAAAEHKDAAQREALQREHEEKVRRLKSSGRMFNRRS